MTKTALMKQGLTGLSVLVTMSLTIGNSLPADAATIQTMCHYYNATDGSQPPANGICGTDPTDLSCVKPCTSGDSCCLEDNYDSLPGHLSINGSDIGPESNQCSNSNLTPGAINSCSWAAAPTTSCPSGSPTTPGNTTCFDGSSCIANCLGPTYGNFGILMAQATFNGYCPDASGSTSGGCRPCQIGDFGYCTSDTACSPKVYASDGGLISHGHCDMTTHHCVTLQDACNSPVYGSSSSSSAGAACYLPSGFSALVRSYRRGEAGQPQAGNVAACGTDTWNGGAYTTGRPASDFGTWTNSPSSLAVHNSQSTAAGFTGRPASIPYANSTLVQVGDPVSPLVQVNTVNNTGSLVDATSEFSVTGIANQLSVQPIPPGGTAAPIGTTWPVTVVAGPFVGSGVVAPLPNNTLQMSQIYHPAVAFPCACGSSASCDTTSTSVPNTVIPSAQMPSVSYTSSGLSDAQSPYIVLGAQQQGTWKTINGTVTDTGGHALAGIPVAVTDESQNPQAVIEKVTDANGRFHVLFTGCSSGNIDVDVNDQTPQGPNNSVYTHFYNPQYVSGVKKSGLSFNCTFGTTGFGYDPTEATSYTNQLIVPAIQLSSQQPAASGGSGPGTATISGNVTSGELGTSTSLSGIKMALLNSQGITIYETVTAGGAYSFNVTPGNQYIVTPVTNRTWSSRPSSISALVDQSGSNTIANFNVSGVPATVTVTGVKAGTLAVIVPQGTTLTGNSPPPVTHQAGSPAIYSASIGANLTATLAVPYGTNGSYDLYCWTPSQPGVYAGGTSATHVTIAPGGGPSGTPVTVNCP